MTEKELGQMHYLNREIEKLNEELSWMECKSMIKSPLLTGMPFGTGVSDKTADYAVRMEEIRELIDLSIKKLLHTRAEIERFLQEIGEELGMDRRTASRKYQRFCEEKFIHNVQE